MGVNTLTAGASQRATQSMNTNKGGAGFVDCSLSVDADTANVNVNFEGTYPVEIGGHTIFLSNQRDEMRFFCTICEEEIVFSEAVWRTATAESRRKATKYALGHFYDAGCGPGEVQDTIKGVVNQYLGQAATPDTMRAIKEELKNELSGYG